MQIMLARRPKKRRKKSKLLLLPLLDFRLPTPRNTMLKPTSIVSLASSSKLA
jgi:hypothetical protein